MDKDIIFQVPGTISGVKSMAHKSWRFSVDTQEDFSSGDIKKLSDLRDKLGWFTMVCRKKNEKIKPDDLLDLSELVEVDVKQKSTSQRLYNVLFVLHSKTGGKKEDFEVWRLRKMEQIIGHYKEKIPQD